MLDHREGVSLNGSVDRAFFPVLSVRKLLNHKKFKKVLVIDGDQDAVALLQSMLGQEGMYSVEVAQDPFDAIDKMTDQAFDLIVLDWNLPKMNGLQTLLQAEKWFRCDPNLLAEWEHRRVPVVIFSASARSECLPPYTKHFRYSGYVNKTNPIETVFRCLTKILQKEFV